MFNMTSFPSFSTYQKNDSPSLVGLASLNSSGSVKQHSRNSSSNAIKSDIDSKSKSLLTDTDYDNQSIITIPKDGSSSSSNNIDSPLIKDNNTSPTISSPTLTSQQVASTSDLSSLADQTFEEEHPIRQRIKFMWQWFLNWAKTATYQTWIRIGVVALIIVGVCLAVFVFKVQRHLDVLQRFVDHFGILIGGIVYIAIFTLLIVFLVPVTIPTILAGIIFKLWFGILFIWIASLLGGTIAFLLGRYVFRKSIAKRIEKNKKLVAVDQAIGQEGWKIVLLLRLTPIIPESLLNYALAVTKIKFSHYIICSAVGLIPGCSFFIYVGSMIGNISDIGHRHIQKGEIAMYVISAVAMVFSILFITIIVRRAVNKKLNVEESKGLLDEEAQNENDEGQGNLDENVIQNMDQDDIVQQKNGLINDLEEEEQEEQEYSNSL